MSKMLFSPFEDPHSSGMSTLLFYSILFIFLIKQTAEKPRYEGLPSIMPSIGNEVFMVRRHKINGSHEMRYKGMPSIMPSIGNEVFMATVGFLCVEKFLLSNINH